MATKKKTKKKTGKRRISGVSVKSADAKDFGMLLLGGVAGVLGKRIIENTISKQTAVTIKPEVLFGMEILAGGALGLLVKHPIAKGAGLGIASSAAVQLLQSMGVLNGIPAGMPMFKLPNPNINTGVNGAARAQTIGNVNPYGYPTPGSVGRIHSKRYAGAM